MPSKATERPARPAIRRTVLTTQRHLPDSPAGAAKGVPTRFRTAWDTSGPHVATAAAPMAARRQAG